MMQQIYLVLTERCNLACSHCIRDSSPHRSEAAEVEMMRSVLKQAAALFPNTTILLTGGEPTIYKGFKRILSECVALGLDTIINSNGVAPYFGRADLTALAERGVMVQISLDGERSQHDRIRGKGTFDRALRTLRRLREAGVRCSVSTTVIDPAFFLTASDMLGELDDLGLTHIAIKRATFAGRASSGTPLTSEAWNRGVYALRASRLATPLRMSPMFDLQALSSLTDAQVAAIRPGPFDQNCGAGTAKIYVYPSGDVCACTCFRDLPVGNLLAEPLAEILAQYLPAPLRSEVCGACRYVSACRGGCLGSGYQHTGSLGSPDPRCDAVAAAAQSRSSVPLQLVS